MLFDIVTSDAEDRAVTFPSGLREIDVSQLIIDYPVCVVHNIRHLVAGGFLSQRSYNLCGVGVGWGEVY